MSTGDDANSGSIGSNTMLLILVAVGVILLIGAIYMRWKTSNFAVDSSPKNDELVCDETTGVCRRVQSTSADRVQENEIDEDKVQAAQEQMAQELATA